MPAQHVEEFLSFYLSFTAHISGHKNAFTNVLPSLLQHVTSCGHCKLHTKRNGSTFSKHNSKHGSAFQSITG